MKARVKKILKCELEPAHPTVFEPEIQRQFERWAARRKYKERLPYNLLKGGCKIIHTKTS